MGKLRGDCFDWSEAHIGELKRLHAGGKSPGEISKLWKNKPNAPTRSAVMSKLRNLGLIGDLSSSPKRSKPKPRQQRSHLKSDGISAKHQRKPGGHHSFSFKRLGAVTAPPPAMPRAARVDLEPVKLEHGRPAAVADLNESMCHFPIGDPREPSFAYCGRGAHGASPYCLDHRGVVYVRKAA